MSLTKKVYLTISGYDIKLSDNLTFYQKDQLKLIFYINEYGIDHENNATTRALMPVNPLNAILFIENPDGVDSVSSAKIEDNAVTFYLDSTHTQYVGVSRMQLRLFDQDGCAITLPHFTFEIRENIYGSGDVRFQNVVMVDQTGTVILTEDNDMLDVGDVLTMGTEVAYPQVAKTIKELPVKNNLDGTEKLIVEDNEATKQAPLGTIVDEIKQNSQEKIREIESKLAQTNAQLSKIAKQLKLNVLDFGAKGDGVTDDTEAFQKAIDSIPTGTMSLYFKPSTMNRGGATIYVPSGKYLIKGTIKYKGFITFKGEGFDSVLLHRPTQTCHLFDSDLENATYDSNVLNVIFEDLSMEGDFNVADGTGYSNTAVNMFNVGLSRINRCFIGFFRTGIYYNWDMEHAGGFYNVLSSSSLRSCGLCLDLEYDQFTVTDTNIAIPPNNTYADYAVKAMGGGICLTNCAVEGQVNKALYYLKGCGTSIQGGYTENNRDGSAYAEIDLSSQMFGGVNINQLFTNPLIKFVNLYNPSDFTTSFPRSTGISINNRGIYLPNIQNGSFLNNDTSNWEKNNENYFTGDIVGAGQPFVKRSYRMTKTDGVTSCSMRQGFKINVPNAFVTCVVKMSDDCVPFLNVFDTSKKLKTMQKLADYGNGWCLYGVWIPSRNRDMDYTVAIGLDGSSPIGSTIEFTNVGLYNNGIEYFPTN